MAAGLACEGGGGKISSSMEISPSLAHSFAVADGVFGSGLRSSTEMSPSLALREGLGLASLFFPTKRMRTGFFVAGDGGAVLVLALGMSSEVE